MKFPGIGPRQARRFVYHLLQANKTEAERLLKDIADLRRAISRCNSCFRFFAASPAGQKTALLCKTCQDPHRDKAVLMLLEKDIDLENMEKADGYNGYYFILGGLVPILEAKPESRLRAKELLAVVQKRVKEGLKEIIIALSANREGDNTVEFLKRLLGPAAAKFGLKISVLGRGLSTGTELEYSDGETLKNALKNRG